MRKRGARTRDGTNRRENITDWAADKFRAHYRQAGITKLDIFHYVYGVLHHPGYRLRFGSTLRRELPRIPFAPDFEAFRRAGQALASLHADYESVAPFPLQVVQNRSVPFSWRVADRLRLSKDRTAVAINESVTLAGIPAEAFDYRLGNRSALEWVIDQYKVDRDPKTRAVVSDPNRADDPEYIANLFRKVVAISVETMRIVGELPPEYS